MSLPSFEHAGLPVSPENLAKALGQAAISEDSGLDGRELLRLGKEDGIWAFGQDNIELEEDALIAVNPTSFQHGFISWAAKGGNILGEAMVPVQHPAPQRADLPSTGEKWDEQLRWDGQIINGEDEGVCLVFKSTAHGGKAFVRELMRRVVGKMQDGPNFIVPVISLTSTSYIHKVYGTVYKPAFSVAYWISMDGQEEPKSITKHATPKKGPPKDRVETVQEKVAREDAEAAEEGEIIEEETQAADKTEAAQEAPPTRRRRRSAPQQEADTEAAPARRYRRRSADTEAAPARRYRRSAQ